MAYRVTTETGSVYLITDSTWERLETTDKSGEVRTAGGGLKTPVRPKVGMSMVLNTDLLVESTFRVIFTSKVTEIQEI